MLPHNRVLVVALFVAAMATSAMCIAQEVSVKEKNVPKQIRDAFHTSYPKAAIRGYSKETERGTTVYEVESVEGKTHRDITYNSDGTVVSMEESLPYAEFPEQVRSAVHKEYPNGKITTTEKVTQGNVTTYELVVQSGKQKHELVFNADGSLVKKEKK